MLEERSEKADGPNPREQREKLKLIGFNWSLAGCNVRGPQTSLVLMNSIMNSVAYYEL